MRRREFRAARLECVLAVRSNQSFDGFDQSGKCCFRIGGHGDVDFWISFEILIIRLDEKITGRNTDELHPRLGD